MTSLTVVATDKEAWLNAKAAAEVLGVHVSTLSPYFKRGFLTRKPDAEAGRGKSGRHAGFLYLESKVLELKEKKDLANYTVQKVSLNERYMYTAWRFYDLGEE